MAEGERAAFPQSHELTEQQSRILRSCLDGQSQAALGMGGVGKTALVRELVAQSTESAVVAVTALTGAAATLLPLGSTIHSFMGASTWMAAKVPQGLHGAVQHQAWLDSMVAKVYESVARMQLSAKYAIVRKGTAKKRIHPKVARLCMSLCSTTHLVVDEISMMSVPLFYALDACLRAARNKSVPFGGVTLLLTGDFAQLSPIDSWPTRLFSCELWHRVLQGRVHMLTRNFRQQGVAWKRALLEMWLGSISESTHSLLASRVQGNGCVDLDGVTVLCAYNAEADAINARRFEKLPAMAETAFSATIAFVHNDSIATAKEPDGSVNYEKIETAAEFGALDDIDTILQSIDDAGERKAAHAFARSTGMAPSSLVLRVGAFVMLRINMPALKLVNGSQGRVVGFTDDGFPRVLFSQQGNDDDAAVVIKQHIVLKELAQGSVAVKQLPLILAWAISVDKSQGSTLDSCAFALDTRMARPGQAYVACSRVRSLEGLHLTSYDRSVWQKSFDREVTEFYRCMLRKRNSETAKR